MPRPRLVLALLAATILATVARANYPVFPDVKSGTDICVQELRWPYWNGGFYNTWMDVYWTSVEGTSGGFYSGVPLPAAGTPGPAQAGINYSFWGLSNPLHPTDTISSYYSSPTTFPKPTIAEGTILEDPGQWYFWQTNVWVRVAFRAWQPANGTPHLGYAGEWIRDGATGIWYHTATVQTPFAVTGITGWGGFQEDASGSTSPQRTDYRRLYYHYNGAWISATNFHDWNQEGITTTTYMVDNAGLIETNSAVYLETCNNNTNYYLATATNLTGIVTNQGNGATYSISQPATPAFFDPILVTNYSGSVTGGQLLVQWQILPTSSPQFGYQINVYTNASYTGTVAVAFYDIAPEARQKLLAIPAGITPYPQLTIVDIFNQTNAAVSPTVTNATLLPATSVPGAASGLNFAYYESASNYQQASSGTNWSAMPNFASLTPVLQGAVSGMDLTPRRRRDGYAFNYTGYISVPSNGLYTFTLNSDAGSKLYVDGQLVVNWDGEHSPADLSSWIGLQAGYHALNVQYFCDTQPFGGYYYDSLALSYEGPGITETAVPGTAFFRVPGGSEPAISLSSPTNGATISGAGVPLSAAVTANGNTVNSVWFYNGNNYWAQDTSAPYTASSLFWDSSTNPIRARLYYNGTNIIDSPVNMVNTTNQSLAPWQFGQVFFHDYPSGASILGGAYSLIGDGVDLLTRQISGNCTIIAHLAGLPGTAAAPDGSVAESGWQAGIILRGTTNLVQGFPWGASGSGNAPFVAVFGEVGGGTYYQDEDMVNGGGGYSRGVTGGNWFKLVRTNGTNFTSFVSSDGATWTQVGNTNLPDFGTTLYAGLFTYAEPDGNLYVPWASFDNVSLIGNLVGPPSVTVTPGTDTAYAGQSATFTALPSGNAPFTYQWQLNGANLAGATNSALTLTNVQPVNSGLYSVQLTNASGTASASATLTVLTPPPAAVPILTNNPVGYWRLNESAGPTAYDTMGSYNGTGQGGAIFGVPGVTNAPFTGFGSGTLGAQFGGDSSPSDIDIPAFNFTTTNFTITGWVNCNGVQDSWSGLVFSRNASAEGLMVVNNNGNELRYSWNNNGNDYNASTGLKLPSGKWAFVALTITPTQAIVYFATNGTLQSWTNKTTNVGQTFSGDFYFGCDPNSLLSASRQFNGTLDQIAIYNQTLTAAQLGQFLAAAQQPLPPGVSLTAPASGAGFAAPATLALNASVTTNGQAINAVQFYNGASLLGVSSNAPYSFTWTNVAAGAYTVLAQLIYDTTNTITSTPAFISVNSIPAAPSTITATALASNLISVTWSASTYATSYVLSRNGTAIATLSGTAYLDLGLAAGSNYCYSVVAVGAYGSSSPSASGCATTLAAGGALAWDAAGMAGASDGNGNWGSGPAMWWNGTANQVWSNNNLALFGAGATANCTVTITNNVTPSGLVFNANNGGNYTLAGSGGGIILSGNPVFTANDNSTISAVLQGSGGFTLTGSGALTLSASETFTGATVVQAGTLLLNAYSALNSSPITIQSGATVSAVVSGGNTFQYYGKTLTVDSGGTLTLGNGSFSNLGGYLYLQGGATLGGSDSGSWGSWQINNSDSTIHVTNGSPMTAVISAQGLHGVNGKSLIFNVADVTGDSNVDLLVSGTLTTGGGDNSNYGITKSGAGTMALAGNNSYVGATLISAGTLQVDGSLGTNVVTVASGATLAGTGTVNGATTNLSGGTLAPGDNGVGTLAINNNLTLNSGSKAVLAMSKNGSVSNSQVMVSGRLALGGTLTVTNLGANALAAGDTVKLFLAGTFSGGFTSLTLPNLSAGLLWYTNTLSANGTLSVSNVLCTLTYTAGANGTLSGVTTQTVIYATSGSAVTAAPNVNCRFVNWSDGSMANPRTDASVTNNVTVTANFAAVNLSPPAITNGVTGGKLSLAWASDHTGWRLLAQTNHLAGGLSSNTNDWGTVAGSAGTNQVSVPLNTTNPAEFYRLVYP